MIEIVKGNENFGLFLDSESFTCVFNLYELYYILLRDYGEVIAKRFFHHFKDQCLKIKDENLFEASEFRLKNIKKNLSYTDCLGYIMALSYGLKFLTGDKEFENLEGVEFVK